jgi:tetratricopeptide (TPR) repeat protein
MCRFKHLSVFALCVLLGGTVFAGDSTIYADSTIVADESVSLYGNGVHAFFDRHYGEAVKILSKAEEIKSEDPRAYYFLGLAYLRQKKTERAERYFKKAAQLEFNGRALRDYAVSESLRRIQGAERMRIEKIRNEERINARIKAQRQLELRYGKENAAAQDDLLQSLKKTVSEPDIVTKPIAPPVADTPKKNEVTEDADIEDDELDDESDDDWEW